MPKKINIFLTVIDNLGDIGFACELVRSFHESCRGKYFFDIWTDDVSKVIQFFGKNSEIDNQYKIAGIEEIRKKQANITFLLFHAAIPEKYPHAENELFLRIDYLSFEREWIKNHGKEHIHSTPAKRIIEIIPSPLPGAGGTIQPQEKFFSRTELAKKFGLESEKKWVSLFCYSETFVHRLILEPIPNTQILLLGNSNEIGKGFCQPLPFLSLSEFSSILLESEWAIIRGEVSFISSLSLGVPFFWDMYKTIGGFHEEQANDFLEWIEASSQYRNIFERMNGRNPLPVSIREIHNYFSENPMGRKVVEGDLRKELEKYIDKYYISL